MENMSGDRVCRTNNIIAEHVCSERDDICRNTKVVVVAYRSILFECA